MTSTTDSGGDTEHTFLVLFGFGGYRTYDCYLLTSLSVVRTSTLSRLEGQVVGLSSKVGPRSTSVLRTLLEKPRLTPVRGLFVSFCV